MDRASSEEERQLITCPPLGALHLDVGGGLNPRRNHLSVDPNTGALLRLHDGTVADLRCRVGVDAVPLPDECAIRIVSSHTFEHILAGDPRIAALNECHRLLIPGGTLEIVVPLAMGTWHAYADPTHVSYWVPESFAYIGGILAAHADYGLLPWQLIGYMQQDPDESGVKWEATALFRKVGTSPSS